jgi:hypothetical protein
MSDPMTLQQALREQLTKRLGPVQFGDLNAHLERDAVFIVRPDVDLVACGVAVATDDVDQVRAWILEGRLRKPSRQERERWPLELDRRWNAIVVQPFVLVQDVADPSRSKAKQA